MALKDIYYRLEDKYYAFLDWLDARGIPLYNVADWIESKGIPSFPVAIIALILIVFAIGLLVAGFVLPASSAVMLNVTGSDGLKLADADATITYPNGKVEIKATDSEGSLQVIAPIGKEVGVKLAKDGYAEKSITIKAEKASESRSIVLDLLRKALSRTVQLMQKDSQELLRKEVMIEFSCSSVSDYTVTKETSSGVIELTDIPLDCGVLYAIPKNGYSTEQDAINLETAGQTISIFLEEDVIGKGTVNVFVVDAGDEAVAGVEVSLMSSGNVKAGSKTTAATGGVTFTDIPAGTYYVVVYDPNSKYAEHDGSGSKKILNADSTLRFDVVLSEKTIGKIKLQVRDKATEAAVAAAGARLIRNGVEINESSTNSEGKVEFNVSENVSYDVVIDHAMYLLKTVKGLQKSADYVVVYLEQATAANAQALKVKVVDEAGIEVEDAVLRLRKTADNSIVGSELTTGFDGTAQFERIAPDTYYVEAVKSGYGEEPAISNAVEVKAREINSVQITLVIGSGTVKVTIADEELAPIATAKIEVMNLRTKTKIAEYTTDSQGMKTFSIRADKMAYLVVSASGYADYTTAVIQLAKDAAAEKNIELVKDIPKLEVKFLGLYLEENAVADSLNAGQKYRARLRLMVPKGSGFDEAGIHLRTGSDTSDIMEKDALYIKGVYAPTLSVKKGTSFSPPTGSATDSMHLTSGSAKWADAVVSKPRDGVIEVDADVQVKDSATIGTVLEIHYRGWGKVGGYVRYPADSVLGSSESSGGKQALYAQTNTRQYSSGPSNLCDDAFCYKIVVEDLVDNVESGVFDSYAGKISNDYKLSFTISSISPALYPASQLKISDKRSAVDITSYEITNASGAKITGTGSSEITVPIGDIRQDGKFFGDLTFRAVKEGTTRLEIELISGSERVMRRSIDIRISGANELQIDILPKIIVPYINNNLLIRVTDENSDDAVADAIVTVLKDGSVLATGATDFNGVFAYELPAPGAGSGIEIKAAKPGYKEHSIVINITENILSVTPEKVSEILTIGEVESRTSEIRLGNTTQIPLKIKSVNVKGEFKSLVAFSFENDYAETALPKGKDTNIFLITRLAENGKRIAEIAKVKGSIDIEVESSEYSGTWRINVPVEIRIGFGKEVDNSDCMSIYPEKWDLFTSAGSEKSMDIAISNNCEVNGQRVSLTSLEAKITQANSDKLGSFEATSDLANSTTIGLTNTFQKIAPLVAENAAGSVKLKFKADSIDSGEALYTVVIRAIHQTAAGDEEIDVQFKVNVKINNLQKCVEVIQDRQLVIESCPYNAGYGNYGGYGGQFGGAYGQGYGGGYGNYNPQSYGGYSPINKPWLGQYDDLYQRNYPYSNYQQPYYGNDVYSAGQGQAGNWNCGKTGFSIRNNCASAIEINIDADPGLIVDRGSIDIAPSDQADIQLEPAYMVGNYQVDVKAKVKDSKESSTKIKTLAVTVENSLTKTWADCINLDKKRFKFNDFISKPVKGKVINSCYDSGVRLIYSADAIHILNAESKMIEEVAVIPPYRTGETETMEFEVIKGVKYKDDAPGLTAANPIQQIGQLRYFLTGAYYAVEARGTMSVEFMDRYGARQSIPFNVIFEDLWVAGTKGEKLIEWGSENKTAQDCVNKGALDMVQEFSTDCLKIGTYPFDAKTVIKIPGYERPAEKQVMVIGKEWCGSNDRLELASASQRLEKDGVVVTPEVVGHDIWLTVDASGLAENATARFDGSEGFDVFATRASYQVGTYRAKIPLKLCIAGTKAEVKEPDKAELSKECEVKDSKSNVIKKGSTGAGAKAFGLDKLLFEWGWEKVTAEICDEIKDGADAMGKISKFCDATQFSIALNRKVENIKNLVDNLGNKGLGEFKAETDVDSQKIDGYKTKSSEFFRFVKEQIEVKDDKANKMFVFFIGKDKPLVSVPINKPTGQEKNVETIKGYKTVDSTNTSNIIDWTDSIMNAIPDADKENIVAVVKKIQYNLELLGADKIKINGTDYYIWTYAEYKDFHDKVKTALTMNETATEVKIVPLDSQTEQGVTTAFLNEIYLPNKGDIQFYVGVRNKDELSDEERKAVLEQGKDDTGILSAAGINGSYQKFYQENIEFSSYLIKDNYSTDFKADFKKAYESDNKATDYTLLKKFESWDFTKLIADKPGKYKMNINYDFSDATNLKIAVKAENDADYKLGELEKNTFLYLPIDGRVGIEGTMLNRDDYGIGFTGISNTDEKDRMILESNAGNKPWDSSTWVHAINTTGSSSEKFQLNYKLDYADTMSGTVLVVDRKGANTGEWTFTPSNAVPMWLKITKAQDSTGYAGVLYDLMGGSKSTKDVKNFGWEFVCSSPINERNFKGDIVNKNKAIGDEKFSINIFGGNGTNEYRGLKWGPGVKAGSMVLRTIGYVPAENPYKLSIMAKGDSATIKIKDYETISTSPINLNDKADQSKVRENYSLPAILKNVQDGAMCISPTADKAEIWWKPDYKTETDLLKCS